MLDEVDILGATRGFDLRDDIDEVREGGGDGFAL